jgi:hypothetical protein
MEGDKLEAATDQRQAAASSLGNCFAVAFCLKDSNAAEGPSSVQRLVAVELNPIDIIFAILGVATACKVALFRDEGTTAWTGAEAS